MLTLIKPQYIINENGERVSIVLPINEYERIIEELEDIEDLKLFDEAKTDTEPSMLFDEYVRQRRAK